jgi:protein JSN1
VSYCTSIVFLRRALEAQKFFLQWLLDTSNFPGRYKLLAPRLAPHLSHLCTHKLASSTVLRIINQRHDPEAAQLILDGLFNSSSNVLEDILGDQVHGINMVQKVLSSQYIEQSQKQVLADKVKVVLLTLRVQVCPRCLEVTRA